MVGMAESDAGWSLTSQLFMMGGGVIAGIAVGFALKVATRIALLVLGVLIVVLYGLMAGGFITVNWEAVSSGIETGSRTLGHLMWTMVRQLSASLVGFAGGVALGWRMR